MPKKKKQKTKHSTAGELSQAEIWDDSALIRSWNDAVAEYEYYHSIHARGEDVEEILRRAEMEEHEDYRDADADADAEGQASGEWRPVHPDTPLEAVAAGQNENADAATDSRAGRGKVEVGTGASSHHDDDANGAEQHSLEERRKVAMDQFKSMLGESEGRGEHPPPLAPGQPSTTMTTATPTSGPDLPQATAIANGQVPPPTTTKTAASPSQEQTLENIKMAYYWAGYYSGLYDGQRQAQTEHGAQTR